jgi:AraC-like DNA-binding protein
VPIAIPPANPWRDRVWKEFRAGNLTRAYRDVLLTLATFRGAGGLICPAHATLAERAGCSVSTVRRALAQAFRLGLLSWTERRIRAGWRWLRTSNAYRLVLPGGPVQRGMRPAWPRRGTTGQCDGEGESLKKKATVLAVKRLSRAAGCEGWH